MSDPGVARALRSRWVVTALVCIALPLTAGAQAALDARRELDSLLPALQAATAALDARRSRSGAVAMTRLERGHLRLHVDSTIGAVMSAAAVKASTSIERVFGDWATVASAHSVVARLDSVRGSDPRRMLIRLRRVDPDPTSAHAAALRRAGNVERVIAVGAPGETEAALVVALEAVAAAPLHASLDDDLRWWFRSALPATPESPEELENVYVDLTTASTVLSRRCVAGDARGCSQLLGLEPIDDVIVEGYTAADRRRLVTGDPDRLRLPAKAAEFDRCVLGVDDVACIARLRDMPQESLISAYSSTAARRSFARWAIQRGGDGAYARLRESAGQPLSGRFGIAARMSSDSLIASWHAHVMSGQPAQPAIPPLTALATLLWVGACGALALRSSRWR